MGEWWAVAYEYWLMTRYIVGTIKLMTRYINFGYVSANSARMLLLSGLPQGEDSICRKDNQYVRIIMKMSIDGSRCWMDNTEKWVSMECQWFVAFYVS
jgi:hypothetical protein